MDKIEVTVEICNMQIPCIAGIEVDREGVFEIVSLESSDRAEVEGADLTALLQFEDIYDWVSYAIEEQKVPPLRRAARIAEQY